MKRLIKHFKGDSLKAQLLKSSSGTAGLKLINIFLTLISGVLLARTLGPEDYGIYAFVLSIITLLGLPTKAGLPTLLVRETAKNQLSQRWGLIRGLLKLANSFVFSYSIFTALGAGLFVWWQWYGLESAKAHTFLWALWLLPLVAYEGVRTGILRGLRWVVSSQLPEQLVRPLMLLLLLGVALLMGQEVTPIKAIQFNALAALTAFFAGAFFLLKALPRGVKEAKSEYSIKPWAVSLVPLSLFAGLKMLDSQISIIFLGFLGADEEVGLFKVAATGAGLVTLGLISVNKAIAPQIVYLYNSGEKEKLQEIILNTARGVMAIALPVAIVLVFFGESIITAIFGYEYKNAAPVLAVLCLAQLVNASVGSVAIVLNMTGNEKKTLNASIIALIANAGLALILIPRLGVMGAGLSYALSVSLWNILLSIYLHRCAGIKTFFLCRL